MATGKGVALAGLLEAWTGVNKSAPAESDGWTAQNSYNARLTVCVKSLSNGSLARMPFLILLLLDLGLVDISFDPGTCLGVFKCKKQTLGLELSEVVVGLVCLMSSHRRQTMFQKGNCFFLRDRTRSKQGIENHIKVAGERETDYAEA